MSQNDKPGTAVITGASSGIGAVYADRLARRGHDLILVARDQTRLDAVAAKLRGTGVAVEVVIADLATPAGRTPLEQRLRDDAAIDLLINNAGIAVPGALVDVEIDKVETMIDINITALTRLAAAAARAFAKRGHGAIVNIASVVALNPQSFSGSYSASKAYVLSLTQSMQHELAAKGVRIQAVLPGATRTEIWERSGIDVSAMPEERIMAVDELVDAALVGFDRGEVVTIPSLVEPREWDEFDAARAALGPKISLKHPAPRYNLLQNAA